MLTRANQVDAATGAVYFTNERSGRVQWERPPDYTAPLAQVRACSERSERTALFAAFVSCAQLLAAAKSGEPAAKIEALWRRGADVNHTNEVAWRRMVAQLSQLDALRLTPGCVSLLLRAQNGETALHLAAAGGHTATAEALVRLRANVNAVNKARRPQPPARGLHG
jgi:hypothetical protein